MDGLESGIAMNRKMLSEMAINDPVAFASLAEKPKRLRTSQPQKAN